MGDNSKMKKVLIIITLVVTSTNVFSQNIHDFILGVFKAQQALKTVSYTLVRTDTLVTGDIRTMTGSSKILIDKIDPVFGFKFWVQMNNDNSEMVYDGHIGYETNSKDNPSDQLLYRGAGHLILTDMIKLDTSKAINFKANQDSRFYYLTMFYPDIKEYSVIKRAKTVKISRETMLPLSVRQHQETLGHVQDLFYEAKEVDINNPSFSYNFSFPGFLKDYRQQIIIKSGSPVLTLKDKEAPDFELVSFDNKSISLSKMRGKAVLLDFWELWCGPCLESMPKVQKLYDTYKEKGLLVYGVTNETKQIQSSKQSVQDRKISFPMLIGNEQLKKNYKLNAIPLYILIDKNGKVVFVSEGYSDNMEAAIKAALI